MSNEFHMTRMGQEFYSRQLPQLTKALERIASSLEHRPAPVEYKLNLGDKPDWDILEGLFNDTWDPYEDMDYNKKPEYIKLNKQSIELQEQIMAILGNEHRQLLESYTDTVFARQPMELSGAFAAGFSSAVKMIMAGQRTPSNGDS